ncbi:MAG TPA: hydrogenase maturation peptidase HycI [Candidatus Omnitrophica bacterium]|nr:hydrogenase maturation peptidase HycI [Candidatus Omnitrophota bacterium]
MTEAPVSGEFMLKDILKGKVVIVGIGNVLRGDDGFGPALIERLTPVLCGGAEKDAVCINAGSAPENYTGKIAKLNPDTVLIVDAVHMGVKPGEYKVLKKSDIVKGGFTTHDISPRMFIEYLEKETSADIYMLGVQPKSLSFGEKLSGNVKKTLQEVSDLIINSCNTSKR